MKVTMEFLWYLTGTTFLTQRIFKEGFKKPFYINLIIEQIYHIGVRSFPLVVVVALSTGMVMALQFGVGLEKFGGKFYVPKIVSLCILRELGPVLTCLMIAARVGAGITSEVGSMKVTQQLDAIRALGTSPIKKIVVPRFLACLIAIPLLCTASCVIGILGGMAVGIADLGLDQQFYLQKALGTLKPADFFSGFGKTIFFAAFIAITSCFYGMKVEGGTQGVGIATTKSVVMSSILIVVGDFILTKFFLIFEKLI